MRHISHLLVAALVAACSTPTPELQPEIGSSSSGAPQGTGWESGSRLKAKYYQATDGSKQAFGWHDSQLNFDCVFGPTTDGKTRCVPLSGAVASVGNYFLDAGCSVPVALSPIGCASGNYAASVFTGQVCANGWSLNETFTYYGVGAKLSPAMPFFGKPGSCAQTPVPETFDAYTTTGVVPPSTFVEAVEKVEP